MPTAEVDIDRGKQAVLKGRIAPFHELGLEEMREKPKPFWPT